MALIEKHGSPSSSRIGILGLAYKRDIWSTDAVAEVEQHIAKLEDAIGTKDKGQISDAAQQLDLPLGDRITDQGRGIRAEPPDVARPTDWQR